MFVYLCKRLPGAKVDRARKYAVVGCTKRGVSISAAHARTNHAHIILVGGQGEYEYELHGEVKGEMRTFKVDTRYYSFYAAGH